MAPRGPDQEECEGLLQQWREEGSSQVLSTVSDGPLVDKGLAERKKKKKLQISYLYSFCLYYFNWFTACKLASIKCLLFIGLYIRSKR